MELSDREVGCAGPTDHEAGCAGSTDHEAGCAGPTDHEVGFLPTAPPNDLGITCGPSSDLTMVGLETNSCFFSHH